MFTSASAGSSVSERDAAGQRHAVPQRREQATSWSRSGNCVMGKKVPLKMNMGMITKRNSEANGLSFRCAAANAWIGAANASPVEHGHRQHGHRVRDVGGPEGPSP